MNVTPSVRLWWMLHRQSGCGDECYIVSPVAVTNVTSSVRLWWWMLHRQSGCGDECYTVSPVVVMNATPSVRLWWWMLHRQSSCGDECYTVSPVVVMNATPSVRLWWWMLYRQNGYVDGHYRLSRHSPDCPRASNRKNAVIIRRVLWWRFACDGGTLPAGLSDPPESESRHGACWTSCVQRNTYRLPVFLSKPTTTTKFKLVIKPWKQTTV